MDLNKIMDAETKSVENYAALAQKYPENFYFALGKRLAALKGKSAKDLGIEANILGNSVFVTNKNGKAYIKINGRLIPISEKGKGIAEKAVLSVLAAEQNGSITINRPKDRTRGSDFNEFHDAEGTLFNIKGDRTGKKKAKFQYASGEKDPMLGNLSDKTPALTERQFEISGEKKKFDSSKYEKVANGVMTYYVNKRYPHVDFTDSCDSLRTVLSILFQPDRHLEEIARNPELSFIYEEQPKASEVVVGWQDYLFTVKPSSQGVKMGKAITHNATKIKVQ